MNILLISQDDPFYLAENIEYLIQRMPSHSRIVSAIVLSASPFGKHLTFLQKSVSVLRTFGIRYFAHYAFLYIRNRATPWNHSVKHVLRKHRIPLVHLSASLNDPRSLSEIKRFDPDLLVSIAANAIFKRPLIELAAKGCVNLHTALLPRYRGLMPSFWVMKNNEPFTGVSVFFVDEGIDSGPIIVQKKIAIGSMSHAQLIRATKRLGMDAVIEAIEKIQRGDPERIPNDAGQMTYYHFPERDDVLDFLKRGKRFW